MSDLWEIGKVGGIMFLILMPSFILSVQYWHSCLLCENVVSAGIVENLYWLYLTDTRLPLRVRAVLVIFPILEDKGIYCGLQVLSFGNPHCFLKFSVLSCHFVSPVGKKPNHNMPTNFRDRISCKGPNWNLENLSSFAMDMDFMWLWASCLIFPCATVPHV